MGLLKETKLTKPDIIEMALMLILAIWIIAVLWLLNMAFKPATIELLTIESLSMFFLAFISIAVIAIAIFLADIRHEIKRVY